MGEQIERSLDVFYKELNSRMKSLLKDDVSDDAEWIADLANAAALLFELLPEINWAGFYLFHNGRLLLGPFQGRVACREIAVGRGVCGTAFEKKETLVVEDVHNFPGHIACDERSRSEIVVPLYRGNELVGVLDIDSPRTARFSQEDKAGLEAFAGITGRNC
ncbi:MAG: GAF domain-containing protein [Parasporobacterium sp.]|nr:GAF domain-containing protein [Parasporobacterium sp.]